MKRIQHFLNTLQTNWSNDPGARGAAKMTAGVILIAEGVFGAGRSLVGGRRNNGGGLMSSGIGIVVGGIFTGVGLLMAPQPFADEITTNGAIVDVERSVDSDGDVMYSPVYAYTVNDREYRFNSSVRSSHRATIGHEVTIAYSESEPRNARRLGGIDGNFHWIFAGAGGVVLLLSLFSLAVSLLLIGFGIRLFISGRSDRKLAGVAGSFFGDLMSLSSRVTSGEIDVNRTAVGQGGTGQGDLDTFSTH